MKTEKIFYMFILLLLLPATGAMAKSRGLILLDNFQQAVNLSYQYDGQTSTNDTSEQSLREHLFSEAYRFGVDYGLYHPRLLRGHLAAELKLDQELFSTTDQPSGSSTGNGFFYSVDGIFLERHHYPVNFYANSGLTKVQRAFADSFDLETTSYGAGFFLKNSFIPLQLNYSRYKSVTSGLANDREQSIENYSLVAKHKVRDFSYTEATLAFASFHTDTRGAFSFTESYLTNDFAISNQLTWDSGGKGRTFATGFRYRQEGGDRRSNSSDFSETVLWDFGKALNGGARYANSFQETESQTRAENNGEVWLRHYLFQNLQTHAQLRGRSTDFSFGKEQEVSGMVGADYQKLLPYEGLLTLGFSQTYGVVDRELTNTEVLVRDEKITASILTMVPLLNPDVVPGTIIVRNADRSITYEEGTDYSVDQLDRITYITALIGGSISDGEVLSVDYDIGVDASVKYANNIRSVKGALLLLERRFRIFGGWDDYDQELLSGKSDVQNLLNSRTYNGGVEINGAFAMFRAEYVNHDSTTSVYQSVDGSFRYSRNFDVNSWTLYVKDRLTFRKNPPPAPSGTVIPGFPDFPGSGSGVIVAKKNDTENTFTVGAIFRRPLPQNFGTVKTTADYLSTSGLNRRDALSLGMGILVRFGKVIAELKSDFHWLITDASTRRDDLVRLEITRHF